MARIYGLDNAEANELLQFDNGMEAIVMNLEEDNVGAVLLGPTDRIKGGRHRKTHGPHRLYRCQRGDDRACDRPVGKPDRRTSTLNFHRVILIPNFGTLPLEKGQVLKILPTGTGGS